jgi:hypothetical protein
MKSRLTGRVITLVLVSALAVAPSTFAARNDREAPRTPRERIVKIIKQIRNLVVPTDNDEGTIPPKP